MGRLEGKVAFISGAARGMGRSHAVRMAEEGADIIAFDLCAQIASVEYPMATPEDLEETIRLVEARGRRIVARKADVRDRDAVKAVLDEGVAELGRVDIVLGNAGIFPTIGAGGSTWDAFHDCIDVMLTGVYNTVHPVVERLVEADNGGCIVLMSSTAGLQGVADAEHGFMGYAVAKHAVVGMMRTWAVKLGKHNIRANTVHPTGVNTPMLVNEAFGRFIQEHPEIAATLQNLLPVELIEPYDVSNAIIFLCSDEGRYVTGQTLAVDAGFTSRP